MWLCRAYSTSILAGLSATKQISVWAWHGFDIRLTRQSAGDIAMRHYTVTMMHGFSTFSCPICKHSVTTRDFHSENGNCRTQAARVMNEHYAATHASRPLSAYGSRNGRTY